MAPRLLLTEVANTFWKKTRRQPMSTEDAQEHLAALPRFFASLFEHDDLIAPALSLACTLDHPVYDFIYIAGARRRDALRVTTGRKLVDRLKGSPDVITQFHLADGEARSS